MNNKTHRLKTIIQILENQKIASQEELLEILLAKGFELTQATLSRDLKYLKVGKIADDEKGMIYVVPNKNNASNTDDSIQPSAKAYRKIEFSNNLCVLKTIPGYANAIASKIDSLNLYEIIGTIAGDDTILVIPREGITKQDLTAALNSNVSELNHILNI